MLNIIHLNKKYLWVLSRTATMKENTYQQIISRIKERGFDISKIKLTKQK
jgi:lipocalin